MWSELECRACTFYHAKVCRRWQSTQAAVEKRKQCRPVVTAYITNDMVE